MLPACVLSALLLICSPQALGQKQKVTPEPIEAVKAQPNFNLDKFSGQLYLLSIVSECNYLKVNNHRVEATVVQASRSTKPKATEDLSMKTLRKLDGICWEIRQEYPKNKVSGRFTVKGRGSSLKVEMVVGETDYENYAILYYQRQRKITLKLYGRKKTASDDIYRKFEEHVSGQGIDLIYIYPFPSYGFCEKTDQFHILDENSG
uniref:Lipocalin/cytosolic fatty-acid binding domain-containing protein n=1 Tax=Leptobrachium leishanense TaxID=445787 RepID=A0A8C5WJT8_9ANUR